MTVGELKEILDKLPTGARIVPGANNHIARDGVNYISQFSSKSGDIVALSNFKIDKTRLNMCEVETTTDIYNKWKERR